MILCGEDAPVLEQMMVIKQPFCATCEEPLAGPEVTTQRRYILWDPNEQIEGWGTNTQLDQQEKTVASPATQVDGWSPDEPAPTDFEYTPGYVAGMIERLRAHSTVCGSP